MYSCVPEQLFEQHAGCVRMRASSTSEPGWQSSATGVDASGSSAAPRQTVASARLSSSACTALLRPSCSCSVVRLMVHAARRLYLKPAGVRLIMALASARALRIALRHIYHKSICPQDKVYAGTVGGPPTGLPELTGWEVLQKLGVLHCAHTNVAGQHRRAPAVAAPEGGRAACRGRQLSGRQLGRRRCRGQQRCITCGALCTVRQQPAWRAFMNVCL